MKTFAFVSKGFSLIEVMVTISIIAILMMLAGPTLSGAIQNSRARSLVSKFTQDFAWARNQAVISNSTVTLTVAQDCSWVTNSSTATNDTNISHSTTAVTIQASAPGFACVLSSQPLTVSFDNRGFVTAASTGTISFISAGGTTWPLQIFSSGSLVNLTGAS